jgi:dTDP-4-dehydrorhamnose reductase
MRILVTGAGGLLGSAVVADARARRHDVVGIGHDRLDVRDRAEVHEAVSAARPDAVVHCAAYTAVDRAESESGLARAVNRDGTRHVAEATRDVGATLLYVSTDYVFDGKKRAPYLPSDAPAPLSVYGRTKLEGEEAVASVGGRAMVARTSWLYGRRGGFVPAILRRARRGETLRVVDDQRGRPTWAPHAATVMLDLLDSEATGVWHVANEDDCTWLDLAREAIAAEGLDVEVLPVSTQQYGAAAPRPVYSVLDLHETEEHLGRQLPTWREGLRCCCERLATR